MSQVEKNISSKKEETIKKNNFSSKKTGMKTGMKEGRNNISSKTSKKPFVKNKINKKKKKSRTFIVKVCTSKKSCGDHYGPFIWERICNEYDEKIDQDSFEKNGITYKKSACQGRCKRSSNVQVEDPQKKKTTQFSYMTPLKAAKLISSIRSGAAPENIKRL